MELVFFCLIIRLISIKKYLEHLKMYLQDFVFDILIYDRKLALKGKEEINNTYSSRRRRVYLLIMK
jgi:hypothetical protein